MAACTRAKIRMAGSDWLIASTRAMWSSLESKLALLRPGLLVSSTHSPGITSQGGLGLSKFYNKSSSISLTVSLGIGRRRVKQRSRGKRRRERKKKKRNETKEV